MITVAELRIHPVKSLRGGLHPRAWVDRWGLEGDRRWMVVDPQGRFITQRDHAHMAMIGARNVDAGVVLSAPGMADAAVPFPPSDAETLTVTVWRDTLRIAAAGAAADDWMRAALGLPCRLVHMADPAARKINPAYAAPGEPLSLADGYPALLVSLASLADLNSRLAAPIPIGRFRPNIVVAGAAPWEEDRWRRIRIGGVTFRVVKPCDRCIITTIDPATGTRPNKSEPLRTLGLFRRDQRGGVMFGQNLIPDGVGPIAVGDSVEVLEAGEPNVMLAGEARAVEMDQ